MLVLLSRQKRVCTGVLLLLLDPYGVVWLLVGVTLNKELVNTSNVIVQYLPRTASTCSAPHTSCPWFHFYISHLFQLIITGSSIDAALYLCIIKIPTSSSVPCPSSESAYMNWVVPALWCLPWSESQHWNHCWRWFGWLQLLHSFQLLYHNMRNPYHNQMLVWWRWSVLLLFWWASSSSHHHLKIQWRTQCFLEVPCTVHSERFLQGFKYPQRQQWQPFYLMIVHFLSLAPQVGVAFRPITCWDSMRESCWFQTVSSLVSLSLKFISVELLTESDSKYKELKKAPVPGSPVIHFFDRQETTSNEKLHPWDKNFVVIFLTIKFFGNFKIAFGFFHLTFLRWKWVESFGSNYSWKPFIISQLSVHSRK